VHPPERGARPADWTDRVGSDHDRPLRPRLDGALGMETQEDARGKRLLTPFVCSVYGSARFSWGFTGHLCTVPVGKRLQLYPPKKPTFDSAIVRLLVESPCTHLRSSLYPPLISLDFVPTILLL